MTRNQVLVITFCSLAWLGYAKRSANAGWFGPSNYAECMLEKLKDGRGQPGYLVERYAKEACNLKFPCGDDAEFTKCMSGYSDKNYCDMMCNSGR